MSEQERSETAAPEFTGGGSSMRDMRRDEEFAAFYRSTTRELVAFLLLHGASLVDAADVVQDTMTAAYRRWHQIDYPRAWAYRVAARALARRSVDAHRETPVDQPPEPNPVLRTTELDHWEQHQDIIVELATLPPRQRQIMAWAQSGYTPTEIAAELDLAPGTVRQNLALARKTLSTRRSQQGGGK
jgi:RNA polymerase sigma factor (sigma-70 family)